MARKRLISLFVAAMTVLGLGVAVAQAANRGATHGNTARHGTYAYYGSTSTPIKHLVVIFQENVSFDHYFGTYPHAANTDGNTFHPAAETPTVNGLSKWLRTRNPNNYNGARANPMRLRYDEAATCDQGHGYTAEQSAFDHGLLDQFVQFTGAPHANPTLQACLAAEGNPATDTRPNNYAVMDYYDGNTVTGLWNYAQRFAMSDNSWSDTFGPSTPGAFNVTTGNTYGAICGPPSSTYNAPPCTAPTVTPGTQVTTTPGSPQAQGPGTNYSDSDPYYDVCSSTQDGRTAVSDIQMGGTNVGDLLTHADVTWGWFQGGFASPNYHPGNPSSDDLSAVCTGQHPNILGQQSKDYNPHHEPFQYFQSTSNPLHQPPSSISSIGRQDQANHQYDLKDFWAAADHGNMPAVSYLKAADYQDGHAAYSDPIDEQHFLVNTINHLEQLPTWKSTAVVIAYDDSDGWYDHQMGPILTQSQTTLDTLWGANSCGNNPNQVPTNDAGTPEQARCGLGMRQPLLVISPFSRSNFVDNHLTSQASVVKFVEDNWLGRQRIGNGSNDAVAGRLNYMFSFYRGPSNDRLFLNPDTGQSSDRGHGRGDYEAKKQQGKRR